MDNNFDLFMQTVDEPFKEFVTQLNEYLRENGCKCVIKTAKSGYVVSYVSQASNKSLANFVSRKTGMKLRIYAPHVAEYQDFLNTLPPKMKAEIKKSSVCKRLLNPDDCNTKCSMGYTFEIDGELCQKCRQMAFFPTLSVENNPYIMQFLKNEISYW